MNRKYTWKKQESDHRDFSFTRLAVNRNFKVETLPSVVNNRKWCSAVENQGALGSCTANAWVGLLEYNKIKSGNGGTLYQDLSRLFIYYNEREIEGNINVDSGAYLRSGAKTLATQGVCIESEWPYKINSFKQKPIEQCYTDALPNVIHSYYALNSLDDMKTCLANGQCFVFGFMVYSGFESKKMTDTGVLNMPSKGEKLLGGHAVMAIGYNETQKRFLIKNSWGTNWGLKGTLSGYFTMPYAYISNSELASDFWTVVN